MLELSTLLERYWNRLCFAPHGFRAWNIWVLRNLGHLFGLSESLIYKCNTMPQDQVLLSQKTNWHENSCSLLQVPVERESDLPNHQIGALLFEFPSTTISKSFYKLLPIRVAQGAKSKAKSCSLLFSVASTYTPKTSPEEPQNSPLFNRKSCHLDSIETEFHENSVYCKKNRIRF